jgi:hypothetical protein
VHPSGTFGGSVSTVDSTCEMRWTAVTCRPRTVSSCAICHTGEKFRYVAWDRPTRVTTSTVDMSLVRYLDTPNDVGPFPTAKCAQRTAVDVLYTGSDGVRKHDGVGAPSPACQDRSVGRPESGGRCRGVAGLGRGWGTRWMRSWWCPSRRGGRRPRRRSGRRRAVSVWAPDGYPIRPVLRRSAPSAARLISVDSARATTRCRGAGARLGRVYDDVQVF